MATLAAIKAAADARLADFFPKVRTKQETYFGSHGKYWQGIAFSTVPDDGALVTPDYGLKPTDQNASWSDASAASELPSTVEAQLRCDVYAGPGGVHGYFLTARVSKSGTTYRRTAQVEMGTVVTTGTWGAE